MPTELNTPESCLYVAAPEFIDELTHELGDIFWQKGRLVSAKAQARPPAWALDVWPAHETFHINSIGHAAQELKSRGKFWALLPIEKHRRATLIQEKLRCPKINPLAFTEQPDLPDIGGWSLLDERTLVASPTHWKKFPHGEITFIENKSAPPNRAYLKLWEALTLINRYPQKGERCLDLGASPGGWTWVLSELGAQVTAIDKAPLEPSVTRRPNVTFEQQSAFSIDLEKIGEIDWLCCDVICYPERLYTHVNRWLETGLVKNFICTIKLQGKKDFAVVKKFQEIPGSFTTHLFHNKHELTWLWPFNPSSHLYENPVSPLVDSATAKQL